NTSLEIISNSDTRSVLRLTLIRGYNCSDELIPEYAKMIRDSGIHFIEAKSYMHIGRSTNRLERSDMLEMSEVRHFASELARQSEIYSIMDESDISRIVVLQNQNRIINRWITSYASTN
ncbi:MAG TPA: 4-demethylwyosine synthase TYW1, partial [Candidatus Bathyarchaeia archaeon]|nr:4-demethylwyosine synthase TYW1 [Candidatus Bathyarchaeia archaeon]